MDRHFPNFPRTVHPAGELYGDPPQRWICDLADALEQSQRDIEEEKLALARKLHDELGGLLVGAIMDIGWIAQQSGHCERVREKLARATGLLRAAIDMKREVIENLRPTLLDNVGLFATLRWHLKASCDAAGVPYSQNFPPSEMSLHSDLKIAVFRIFQEALKYVLSCGTAREVDLEVIDDNDTLHCHLKSLSFEAAGAQENARVSPETSMRHRVRRAGGSLQWLQSGGANHIHLQMPFRVLHE
jgi:signal transduction histidine kinase